MFNLNYQGSVIKVDLPSEILISDKGLFVSPINSFQPDPSLVKAADASVDALSFIKPKRAGREKDPNSLHARLTAYVNDLKSRNYPRSDIQAMVRETFPDKPSTVNTYLSEALRGYVKVV